MARKRVERHDAVQENIADSRSSMFWADRLAILGFLGICFSVVLFETDNTTAALATGIPSIGVMIIAIFVLPGMAERSEAASFNAFDTSTKSAPQPIP